MIACALDTEQIQPGGGAGKERRIHHQGTKAGRKSADIRPATCGAGVRNNSSTTPSAKNCPNSVGPPSCSTKSALHSFFTSRRMSVESSFPPDVGSTRIMIDDNAHQLRHHKGGPARIRREQEHCYTGVRNTERLRSMRPVPLTIAMTGYLALASTDRRYFP